MITDDVAFIAIGEIAPYLFVNLAVAEYPALIGNQQKQNLIFFYCEFYFLLVKKDFSVAGINLKTGKGEYRFRTQFIFPDFRMTAEYGKNLLKGFGITILKFQNDHSSDAITSRSVDRAASFNRAKVVSLTTCSSLQASSFAISSGTPASRSRSVKN